VGVFCLNVATAAAIYRAIVHWASRHYHALPPSQVWASMRPANYEALLAHQFAIYCNQPKRNLNDINRLIIGGPMMGYTLPHADIPVIKTTNCIIAATAKDFPPPPPEMPCIRCGDCADVCPVCYYRNNCYGLPKVKNLIKPTTSSG
jgi:electron transport complex protein RnfC